MWHKAKTCQDRPQCHFGTYVLGKEFRCGKLCGQLGEKFPFEAVNRGDQSRQPGKVSDSEDYTSHSCVSLLCQFASLDPDTFTNAVADVLLRKTTSPPE